MRSVPGVLHIVVEDNIFMGEKDYIILPVNNSSDHL